MLSRHKGQFATNRSLQVCESELSFSVLSQELATVTGLGVHCARQAVSMTFLKSLCGGQWQQGTLLGTVNRKVIV